MIEIFFEFLNFYSQNFSGRGFLVFRKFCWQSPERFFSRRNGSQNGTFTAMPGRSRPWFVFFSLLESKRGFSFLPQVFYYTRIYGDTKFFIFLRLFLYLLFHLYFIHQIDFSTNLSFKMIKILQKFSMKIHAQF